MTIRMPTPKVSTICTMPVIRTMGGISIPPRHIAGTMSAYSLMPGGWSGVSDMPQPGISTAIARMPASASGCMTGLNCTIESGDW